MAKKSDFENCIVANSYSKPKIGSTATKSANIIDFDDVKKCMNVVILRCKNCGEANWKIYIKKICGASTCRMTMIRRALDSPMSKDLPRYLERCRRPHRKFSRVAWKKSSSSKHDVLSEYSSSTLSFIFQNLNFFHFSSHIFRLMRRMVTIFLLTQG